MENKRSFVRRATDKLFGGIRMTWPKVIIFAVASALLTAAVLIIPIFLNTSLMEIGVSYEAWILFAIIIMVNCGKPLESAVKTFVFFLISQPLIYLLQVPFYEGGFQIFQYYRFWIFPTLLTFPMAFVGWYLKKRSWLSLLILSPIILLLSIIGAGYAKKAILCFPDHLLAALFCFGQIVLYLYVFFDGIKKRLVGLAIPIVTIAVILLFTPQVDTGLGWPLSDDIQTLSQEATVELDDSSFGSAQIIDYEDPYLDISVKKYGETTLRINDHEKTYVYHVECKMIDGVDRVLIEYEGTENETKN